MTRDITSSVGSSRLSSEPMSSIGKTATKRTSLEYSPRSLHPTPCYLQLGSRSAQSSSLVHLQNRSRRRYAPCRDLLQATALISNWTKGNLAEEMDFGKAVVRDATPSTGKDKRGHPVYYQASDPSHNAVSVISSLFVVVRKDYDGNTWFSISLPGKMWSDLMDYLEQFA